jgi:ABC-type phosphate transport system substrate-binding protein
MEKLGSRWRRIAGAGVVATATGATVLALTVPAGASTSAAANNTIIGSGSQAAYPTVVALNELFNGSPGCNIVAGSGNTQQQNFSCASPANGGEDGYSQALENPIDDVALAEPAYGSNVGIDQLEDQGAHNPTGVSTAPINYASSSRGAQSSDLKGLNFVAWAKGGISWIRFTKVNGKATPCGSVTNLTTTQILDIYNGSITNWNQVGCSKSETIVPYLADVGSGIGSAFAKAIGFTSTGVPAGVNPSDVINQDSVTTILKNANEAGAIYYYSAGWFNTHCPKGVCDSLTKTTKKDVAALGSINSIAPSQSTIEGGTFPVINFLYNVYSNGSNSNIPVASQATLNYASEDGFLCKTGTSSDIDPITGVAYRTEIVNDIENTGFYPVETTAAAEGTVDTPAPLTTSSGPYSGINDLSGSDPTGYCLVTTTDANANS